MSCRAMVPRLAPRADRMASSDCRALARTSSRLATLAQPMSSTKATPPCSMSRVVRTGRTRCSCTPPTFSVMPERSTNDFNCGGPAST